MSIHQSIERQEREFKELLQKVMQAPLSPLTDSLLELKERMDLLEQEVSEMHEIELGVLNQGAVDTRKQIQSLKSITEETPREVCDVLQPLLEQMQMQLEQRSQQHIHRLTMDLAGQLAHTEQQAAIHAANLKDAITASQGNIESSQNQGFKNLENLQQTVLIQLHTEYESLRGEFGSQLAEQSAEGQRAVARVQELLSLHSQELSQQSASGFRQLGNDTGARMSQLTQSMDHLQTLLSAQQQELNRLQQQAAYSERLGEQMQKTLMPLRKWLIVSVCVAAPSLAGVVFLVVGKL
jgi:hypothetical protein